MHLVRYHVAVSLDGFIAPPDGSAAWLEPYGKVAMGFIGPWMQQIGGIVVGRATYDQAIGMGGWMWGKTPALVMTSRPVDTGSADDRHARRRSRRGPRPPAQAHDRAGSRHRHLAVRRRRHRRPVPEAQPDRSRRTRRRAGGARQGQATVRRYRNPADLRTRRRPAHRHGRRRQQLSAHAAGGYSPPYWISFLTLYPVIGKSVK